MDKVWRGRLIRYTPFVLWTGIVLAFSTGGASMSNTSRIIRPLLQFLFPGAPEATLIFYHGVIRKSAHFFEYGVLGLLAIRAFAGSAVWFLGARPFFSAFIAALLVAMVDETNQSFDPSRTGSFGDVAIDLAGAACALGVAAVIKFRRKN